MTSAPSFVYRPPLDPLDIIYQDDFIIALNKPAGLLSVPGRLEEHADSLATRLQIHYPHACVVHRLDMATSGLILFALDPLTQKQLHQAFAHRQVHKHYIAQVVGALTAPQGSIDLPLITDWPNRPRQKVDTEHGKAALTHYEQLRFNQQDNHTRLRLTPITGRSHQLRVHLAAIGHPICGDRLYAPAEQSHIYQRMYLHAVQLSLAHPHHGDPLIFTSPVPF